MGGSVGGAARAVAAKATMRTKPNPTGTIATAGDILLSSILLPPSYLFSLSFRLVPGFSPASKAPIITKISPIVPWSGNIKCKVPP
ncbi:hypothetical protein ES703_88862 [subsurface metagenome]